jgi:hypothetical protein
VAKLWREIEKKYLDNIISGAHKVLLHRKYSNLKNRARRNVIKNITFSVMAMSGPGSVYESFLRKIAGNTVYTLTIQRDTL